MADTTYLKALALDAKCFGCLTKRSHAEIRAYLLAFMSGLGTDFSPWAARVKCLRCLETPRLNQIKAYLLAIRAGISTNEADLINAARCFFCLGPAQLINAQTYLLAQDPSGPGLTTPQALGAVISDFRRFDKKTLLEIEVFALATMASVATDPVSLEAAAKCMICLPQPLLVAVMAEVIDFVEPVPTGSARTGLTPPPDPPPPPGGPPPGRGGGLACTDTIANLTPVITAHYVAGAITTIDILVPRTCCKKSSYELFGSNSADMSGAVLVSGGSNPNKTVNWTITGIDVSLAGFTYYAAQSVCVGGLTSPFSNIVLSVDGSTIANDWANRVVVNGGPMPSQNSINACETFVEALMLAGIWTKMIHVNMVAPDSANAFKTPLLVGTGGNAKYTDILAPLLDLTINGARINVLGSGAYQTGLNLNTVLANDTSNGVSFYVTLDSTANEGICGNGVTGTGSGLIAWYRHASNNSGITDFSIASLLASSARVLGFQSFNRTANNVLRFYRASSINPFALVVQDNTLNSTARTNAAFFPVWGHTIDGGLVGTFDGRCSFYALHLGLTQTEDQALYNAVQALRTTFGGGTI